MLIGEKTSPQDIENFKEKFAKKKKITKPLNQDEREDFFKNFDKLIPAGMSLN